MALSNSEVDRLGDRLRVGVTPEDRDLYFDWREEFTEALSEVEHRIRDELGYHVTSRRKTLDATVAKLSRETIRLSQVQDVAGCRIVVDDLNDQNQAVAGIHGAFQDARVEDLRESPHHGYRAVHVIVGRAGGKLVEVQVRTEIQDRWAQLSEKLADRIDMGLKYGTGPKGVRNALEAASEVVVRLDRLRLSTGVRDATSADWDAFMTMELLSALAELADPAAEADST